MDINIHNYLRLDLVDMVMVMISTGLIVLIGKKFFWNHVKDYIDGRQKFVADQLQEATLKLQESEQLEKTAKDELVSLRKNTNNIIDEAKDAATKEANEIKKQAIQDANSIKEKARKDIEQQKVKAMDDVKDEMVEIAMLTASKIVKKELDSDIQKAYVKEFIDEVSDDSWQA